MKFFLIALITILFAAFGSIETKPSSASKDILSWFSQERRNSRISPVESHGITWWDIKNPDPSHAYNHDFRPDISARSYNTPSMFSLFTNGQNDLGINAGAGIDPESLGQILPGLGPSDINGDLPRVPFRHRSRLYELF